MAGIEFVTDKKSKTPNAKIVNDIVDYATEGLPLENAGTYGNVIRFLTPLCITDGSWRQDCRFTKKRLKPVCNQIGIKKNL